MDIKATAAEASKILETVMNVEPDIARVIGLIPGAGTVEQMVQPVVMVMAPAIMEAMKALSAGDPAGTIDPIATLMKHIFPGMPNAPALSGGVRDN